MSVAFSDINGAPSDLQLHGDIASSPLRLRGGNDDVAALFDGSDVWGFEDAARILIREHPGVSYDAIRSDSQWYFSFILAFSEFCDYGVTLDDIDRFLEIYFDEALHTPAWVLQPTIHEL